VRPCQGTDLCPPVAPRVAVLSDGRLEPRLALSPRRRQGELQGRGRRGVECGYLSISSMASCREPLRSVPNTGSRMAL
jgi:hypothetical protein